MSFDIRFCTKDIREIDHEEVSDYLRTQPYFEVNESDGGFQSIYKNLDTGVYFIFESSPELELAEEEQLPPGYQDTGLWFTLNLIRPTFFAHEALPYVEEFTKKFDLLIVDPQDDSIGGNGKPKICNTEELIASWAKSNEFGVKAFKRKEVSESSHVISYMPLEKSMNWWEYSKGKKALEEKLGDDFFVPRMFILKDQSAGELKTAISWTDGIPQIFASCDLVGIVKMKKRLFSSQTKSTKEGFIEYDDLMKLIGDLAQPFQGPVSGIKILKSDKTREVQKIFKSLRPQSTDEFKSISPDEFIDIQV
ncbi:hypothetical protein A3I42_01125 [Candidatus Uhrbacteria bacterium RIFCSPLOWO2_02_FULL_49_11]|uniref:Uncharacterized protein n=1 Tax=Candidatus Uhrbacteria bacterium RIFCSPLOWO2_02_FULL_49_11 TaxID=1802409 RepID=A0A1F7VEE2_9BACT|nr:MAG: hypothetical protein A3I42_01125 [Candidatus Uhrbacteria bacterium RIFCSPLOWO2_02_FULL_49_11]